KLPFVWIASAGLNSMKNPSMDLTGSQQQVLLNHPVKNIFFGASPYYTEYRPGAGIADYYDSRLDQWLNQDLNVVSDLVWGNIKGSPTSSYLLGIISDDGDQMYGFAAGDTFPSGGHVNSHLGWIVATASPVQTASTTQS